MTAIRACVETDRYALTVHFSRRMQQRGLFRPNVRAVLDDPVDVMSQGADEYGRPKWVICGEAAIGAEVQIVCALEIDEAETEFITLYWID